VHLWSPPNLHAYLHSHVHIFRSYIRIHFSVFTYTYSPPIPAYLYSNSFMYVLPVLKACNNPYPLHAHKHVHICVFLHQDYSKSKKKNIYKQMNMKRHMYFCLHKCALKINIKQYKYALKKQYVCIYVFSYICIYLLKLNK